MIVDPWDSSHTKMMSSHMGHTSGIEEDDHYSQRHKMQMANFGQSIIAIGT